MRRGATSDEGCEALFTSDGPGAMRAVWESFGPLVYTYCRRNLAPDLVDDCVQEVFVAAWRNRERFDPAQGRLAAWLLGIAKHKVVDTIRRTAKAAPATDLEAEVAVSDDSDAIANRLLARHALSVLPERSRRVMELAYLEGLTHAEVAARSGLPLGTVKSDIRRALVTLREYVGTSDVAPV